MKRHHEQAREQARDRFLELRLDEELGAQAAPDATTAVLARLAQTADADTGAMRLVQAKTERPPHASPWRVSIKPGFLCGVAAGVLAMLSLTAPPALPPRGTEAIALHGSGVRIRGGEALACRAPQPFTIAPLDHLVTDRAFTLRLVPLGVLRIEKQSELEILAMNWKEFGGGAVLGSITVAVVTGLIEWSDGTKTVRAGGGQQIELSPGTELTAGNTKQLQQHLAEARRRIEELEESAQRQTLPDRPEATGLAATATEANEPAGKGEARFRSQELDGLIDKVDWQAAGAASTRLTTLMDSAMDLLLEGKPLPLEILPQISEVNSNFLKATEAVLSSDLPGIDINSKYGNPTILANILGAHLDALGRPLTSEQRGSIDRIAKQLATEDAHRRAGYTENTPRLQQLLDETGMVDRFGKEAGYSMNGAQLESTFAGKSAGRTVDFFGSGASWANHSQSVTGADQGQISSSITSQFENSVGFDATQSKAFANIARQWVQRFPEDLWGTDDKPTKVYGSMEMMQVARVRAAAKMQLGMINDALQNMQLTPQQRTALLKNTKVWVPYLRR